AAGWWSHWYMVHANCGKAAAGLSRLDAEARCCTINTCGFNLRQGHRASFGPALVKSLAGRAFGGYLRRQDFTKELCNRDSDIFYARYALVFRTADCCWSVLFDGASAKHFLAGNGSPNVKTARVLAGGATICLAVL